MPSPRLEVFFVSDGVTGSPLTGAAGTFSFSVYKDDTGVDITPVPTISEIGGGLYRFSPTLPAAASRALAYVLDTGGNDPAHFFRLVRQEDWNEDSITDLIDEALGKWQIYATGPDAGRLVLYRRDGSTVLAKFDLKNLAGNPDIASVFQRIPV